MKRFSWILVLSMLIALLSACGSQGGGTDTTGGQAASPAAGASAAPGGMGATATSATAASETSSAGGTLPNLNGRKLVIGTDATYPPMESVDRASNKIVGFDVDLMAEIAKLINVQPEFQNADFSTIFEALQNKQFDAVMSSATITEERKQKVNFSIPYINVGQVVVTRADNSTITGVQGLANGPLVGVQTGTTGEEAAATEAKVPDDKLKRYQTIDLAFADLANGTIDALVADSPTVANYASQPQYKDKVKVVGEPFTTEDYGIAVPKDDTQLLEAINAALTQLKDQGVIDQLKQKYSIK